MQNYCVCPVARSRRLLRGVYYLECRRTISLLAPVFVRPAGVRVTNLTASALSSSARRMNRSLGMTAGMWSPRAGEPKGSCSPQIVTSAALVLRAVLHQARSRTGCRAGVPASGALPGRGKCPSHAVAGQSRSGKWPITLHMMRRAGRRRRIQCLRHHKWSREGCCSNVCSIAEAALRGPPSIHRWCSNRSRDCPRKAPPHFRRDPAGKGYG